MNEQPPDSTVTQSPTARGDATPALDEVLTGRLHGIGDLPLSAHPRELEAVLQDLERELDALRRSVGSGAGGPEDAGTVHALGTGAA